MKHYRVITRNGLAILQGRHPRIPLLWRDIASGFRRAFLLRVCEKMEADL
jgi:hypothetical protein